MALFTCALDVELDHAIGRRAPPVTTMGKCSPASKANDAPMAVNGFATRAMGRRLRLSSPTSRAENAWPLRTPDMRRAVVPLFPQSSADAGARRPPSPSPSTRITGLNGGIATPNARSTPAVEWTSADGRIFRIRDRPLANAAQMSARCEMDLSPGTRTASATPFVIGATVPASSRDPFSRRDTSQ